MDSNSNRIKILRIASGMKQHELSELTGIYQEVLSKIENGGTCKADTLAKILGSLDCPNDTMEMDDHRFQILRANILMTRMTADHIMACCNVMELLTKE